MPEKKLLCMIHFQPLERYPPVMNMINYMVENTTETLLVISLKDKDGNGLKQFDIDSDRVKIIRFGSLGKKGIFRWVNYFSFYLNAFFALVRKAPTIVLYFESISSWPALRYKKWKGKKLRLAVHYHEYVSPSVYKNGMKLVRKMHKTELAMYAEKFYLISETNEVRLRKFRDDYHLNELRNSLFYVIPNYPSRKWADAQSAREPVSAKKKLVFVGSLGFKNTYIQEVAEWVIKHDDLYTLDIYAYNIDEEAKTFLQELGNASIQFKGACDYDQLKTMLPKYDIGLVIYRPFSENTVNAVSNKVFEYLACGLDVWFSTEMIWSHQYIRSDVYPKILAVDFNSLDTFDHVSAIDRSGLSYSPSSFFYENVYDKYFQKLLEQS